LLCSSAKVIFAAKNQLTKSGYFAGLSEGPESPHLRLQAFMLSYAGFLNEYRRDSSNLSKAKKIINRFHLFYIGKLETNQIHKTGG